MYMFMNMIVHSVQLAPKVQSMRARGLLRRNASICVASSESLSLLALLADTEAMRGGPRTLVEILSKARQLSAVRNLVRADSERP